MKVTKRLEMPCFSTANQPSFLDSILFGLTVKLDGALDDVVAHDVAVGEVLGNDSSLSLVSN
jgi:hypothetical protein